MEDKREAGRKKKLKKKVGRKDDIPNCGETLGSKKPKGKYFNHQIQQIVQKKKRGRNKRGAKKCEKAD